MIDFDNFLERIAELRNCLTDIPKPLKVRISSGGKGIHIISFHDDDKGYRKKYDDPERLKLDRIRQEFGLTNNVLAGVKSYGTERKVAGEWVWMEETKNEKDFEYFIKKVLKNYERI